MRTISFLLLMLLGTAAAFAQTATVDGVVTDATQAIAAGATVIITNLDSGLRREVRSNETGAYTFTQLPVGRYKIEAALPGFTTQTRPEIQFDVDQVVRLDFALKPGTPNRIRGTPAAAALLGSETATVGHTLTVSTASNPGGRTASERGFITGGAHSYPMKRSG